MSTQEQDDPSESDVAVPDDVPELLARLAPLPAERAVLSALLVPVEGQLAVAQASLLIGPAAMSRLSWSDWVRHESGRDLGLAPAGAAAAFAIKRKNFTLARAGLTVRQARTWIQGSLAGFAPKVGPVPEAVAALTATRAPALARPGNATPASGFVDRTERPARGFLFPAAVAVTPVPASLTVDGQFLRSEQLIGIDIPTTEPRIGNPASPGVFFGRLTRRAWISRVTYNQQDELLDIWLRLEQADLYELELEIREYVDDDLADCRRVRLAEIPIPARARRRLSVRARTLGRRVQRTVSLYGRGGELLDELVRFGTVERIGLSIAIDGAPAYTTTIGDKRPAPRVVERLADLQRVEESYEWWFTQGAKRRLIAGIDAAALLHRRLKRAEGELLIIDAYFGSQATDWDLLSGITVPTRILTGWAAKPPPTPFANVSARKWMNAPIPFHDRFYFWNSAGLSVGTSPNGLSGDRVFRIDELSLAELKALHDAFAKWWADQRTQPL